MGFVQEFKDFAMRGNVVDMAVGIVIGGAFGGIVKSFVADIIMPAVGVVTGGLDFSEYKIPLTEATTDEAGKAVEAVSMNIGLFANVLINFLIVALAIFMVIKLMNKMKAKEEEEPEKPAEPPREEVLLVEIRDLLAKK